MRLSLPLVTSSPPPRGLAPHGTQHSPAPQPLSGGLPASAQPSSSRTIEGKINARIKAADVNVEPFWPGLPEKGLANVSIESLICKGVAGKSTPAAGAAPTAGPAPSTRASQAEEKELEEKKRESEESDEDVHFGLLTKPLL